MAVSMVTSSLYCRLCSFEIVVAACFARASPSGYGCAQSGERASAAIAISRMGAPLLTDGAQRRASLRKRHDPGRIPGRRACSRWYRLRAGRRYSVGERLPIDMALNIRNPEAEQLAAE